MLVDGGNYGVLVGFLVYWCVTNALYWRFRRDPVIATRGHQLVLFASLAEVWGAVLVLVHQERGIPCGLLQWPYGVYNFIFWLGPNLIRGYKLFFDFKTAESQLARCDDGHENASMHSRESSVELAALAGDDIARILWYKRFNNWRYAAAAMLALNVAATFIALPIFYAWPLDVTPSTDTSPFGLCVGALIYNMGIQAVLVMVNLCVLAVLLWRVHDAYQIKTEFGLLLAVGTPMYIVWNLLFFYAGDGEMSGFFDVHMTVVAYAFMHAVTVYFPLALVWRSRRAVLSVDLHGLIILQDGTAVESAASSNSLTALFNACMQAPKLMRAYEQFTVKSFCTENLLFYMRALTFVSVSEGPQQVHAARRIMCEFLLDDAPFELNIDQDIKSATITAIRTGNVSTVMFDELQTAVHQQMLQDSFSRFVRTAEFAVVWAEYCNDVKSVKQRDSSLTDMQHRRSASSKMNEMTPA